MLARRSAFGGLGLLAVVLAVGSAAWACAPQSFLGLDPSRGTAGTVVIATGSGFPPGGTVEVRWDTVSGPLLGTVVGGSFHTAITIPASASPGIHYVVGVAVGSGDPHHSTGPAVFEVTPPPPAAPPPQTPAPSTPVVSLLPPAPALGGRTIVGTSGGDTLIGTPFADVITCGAGDDVVRGGGGDDVISCGAGVDRVDGGPGNDRILGQAGGDRLAGGTGDDVLMGGSGKDTLRGGTGQDRVFGGGGRDTLFRDGQDLLSGGPGRDRMVR